MLMPVMDASVAHELAGIAAWKPSAFDPSSGTEWGKVALDEIETVNCRKSPVYHGLVTRDAVPLMVWV